MPDKIEITIDGRKLKVRPRSTILNAALEHGIYIPHLCYDRRLKPFGGCRLCIVEVKGIRKPRTACTAPVEPGMVIYTDTPKLQKARRTVVELLLLHHPLECPYCDKAGECLLQDMAYKYGPVQSRFKAEKRSGPALTEAPLVERNPKRCILCGKCVRVCGEHQGVGAIDFIDRGFITKISPPFEETLDCEFCGQCIDVCPVGALGSKTYRSLSRVWYLEERQNICPHCGVGCTVTLGIQDGKIMRSVGKDGVGMNLGDLCGRGRFGLDYVGSEKRLTKPLIRDGEGVLREATWAEAIGVIKKRLGEVIAAHGPQAVGAIGSQRCTIEDNFMLQRFMRSVVGSGNIDSLARFGTAMAQGAVKRSMGLEVPLADFDAPMDADLILTVESDITATHPVFGLKLLAAARDQKAKLIVLDSRMNKLSRHATSWLRLRPGTSVALLNGIMKCMIDEGLAAPSASGIPQFEALKKSLEDYTPERAETVCGVSADAIRDAARAIGASKRKLVCITTGSAENNKGANAVLAAGNLVLLSGGGAEALQIPGSYCNTIGMLEAGVRPDAGPGHTPIENPGLDAASMLCTEASPMRAMYVMGENPVITFPESKTVEQTLKAMEFLVVQDIMLTDTAKLAHVVLPASSWAEKDGTFVGMTGIPQKIVPCVPPTGESLPDWRIFHDIASAMGRDIDAGDFKELTAEVCKAVPLNYDLTSSSPAFVPVAQSGGVEPSADYPFTMVTGILMQHSGSLTTLSKGLESVVSDAYLQINAEDAAASGIADEKFVRVSSPKGEIFLKARVTDEVPAGMLFVPAHFPHARVNTLRTLPPADGGHSLVAVKVEPA